MMKTETFHVFRNRWKERAFKLLIEKMTDDEMPSCVKFKEDESDVEEFVQFCIHVFNFAWNACTVSEIVSTAEAAPVDVRRKLTLAKVLDDSEQVFLKIYCDEAPDKKTIV